MHTKETLKTDLARMGLRQEQTVLVHSSMRAVGTVENRADGVLDALMEYKEFITKISTPLPHRNSPLGKTL